MKKTRNFQFIFLFLTFFSLLYSYSDFNITKKNYNKVIEYYNNNKLNSKEDFNKYKTAFNLKYNNKEVILDNRITQKVKKITSNNTLLIVIEVKNKKELLNIIKTTLGFIPEKEKTIKKFNNYNDLILLYKNALNVCNKLEKINFFKYGKKFKEILIDKVFNKKYILTVNNLNDCNKIKTKNNIIWNSFVIFARKTLIYH